MWISKNECKWGALATLIVSIFKTTLLLIYTIFLNKRIKFNFRHMHMFFYLRKFLKYGMPILAKDCTWALGLSTITSLVGNLGASSMAVLGIFNFIETIVNIPIIALANCANVFIAYEIGAKRIVQTKKWAVKFLNIAKGLGVVFGLLLLVLKNDILSFYNLDAETKLMLKRMINILAFFLVFNYINLIFTQGVFRGSGDTKFSMLTSIFSLWIIAIPLIYLARAFKLSLPQIYSCFYIYAVINSLICWLRLKSQKWIFDITYQI